jgi:hypothetical protein
MFTMTCELDASKLHELLDLDHETGALTWKWRPAEMFSSYARFKSWNDRWAGAPALLSLTPDGYLRGRIFNHGYLAHRVVFAMCHGYWPAFIDHINGVRSDNRPSNLREVTKAENAKNKRRPGGKRLSECFGLDRLPSGRWRARIVLDRKTVHLGCFRDKDLAIAARSKAERDFGFHPNHGRDF